MLSRGHISRVVYEASGLGGPGWGEEEEEEVATTTTTATAAVVAALSTAQSTELFRWMMQWASSWRRERVCWSSGGGVAGTLQALTVSQGLKKRGDCKRVGIEGGGWIDR